VGRKTTEIRINGQVSNHNDEQDVLDREVWQRFVAEVRAVAQKPEYADLEIDVSDMGSW
jgi:hypothetical protein